MSYARGKLTVFESGWTAFNNSVNAEHNLRVASSKWSPEGLSAAKTFTFSLISGKFVVIDVIAFTILE